MSKPNPVALDQYRHTLIIPTRWADNDVYGHVNNAVYYFYFDTLVNQYLIKAGVLDIGKSEIIGLVVETGCHYFAPISFPAQINAALRVAKIGTSSVIYEIGLFEEGKTIAAAQGRFVHVYVNEKTRRPVPLPSKFREALTKISI